MEKVYYNPANPGAFGGVHRLSKKIKRGDVKKWLTFQDAYTLHKPVRHKFPRRRVLVGGIDHQWQIDLADVSTLSKANNDNRYLLTCIDILSKYAWVIPIRNKSSENVTSAMTEILDNSNRTPLVIQADKGKEFLNKRFQHLLKVRGIRFFSTENDDMKASIVERFNRTLKEKMWRYFTYTRKKRYIDTLNQMVSAYNSSKHRTIGMNPKDVSPDDEPRLLQQMYDNLPISPPTTIQIGDNVRIVMTRRPFKKGYTGQWSEEIFSIISMKNSHPKTFHLVDLQNETIAGTFYPQELQKVNIKKDKLYTIDAVLKKRRKHGKLEYFVKFKGYPAKFNQWITKDDVEM